MMKNNPIQFDGFIETKNERYPMQKIIRQFPDGEMNEWICVDEKVFREVFSAQIIEQPNLISREDHTHENHQKSYEQIGNIYSLTELLEDFEMHKLTAIDELDIDQTLVRIEPTDDLLLNDEHYVFIQKRKEDEACKRDNPPLFEFKFDKQLKLQRKQIVDPLVDHLKKIFGVTTKKEVYEKLAQDFQVSSEYVKKIFLGMEPMRAEYIWIMQEKYPDLNFVHIIHPSRRKKLRQQLNRNVLTDLRKIMNSKNEETENEIRLALLSIRRKIENKSDNEIANICDQIIDLLNK